MSERFDEGGVPAPRVPGWTPWPDAFADSPAIVPAGGAPASAPGAAALPTLNRRNFLQTAAAAIGISALANDGRAVNESVRSRERLIDVNINLSRWPLRRLRGDESALLKLKESPLSEEQLGAIRRENAQRLTAVKLRSMMRPFLSPA